MYGEHALKASKSNSCRKMAVIKVVKLVPKSRKFSRYAPNNIRNIREFENKISTKTTKKLPSCEKALFPASNIIFIAGTKKTAGSRK